MLIDYSDENIFAQITECPECGAAITGYEKINPLHGYLYKCPKCGKRRWGGKVANKIKHEKRPACPKPDELGIDACEICLIKKEYLLPGEGLEVHHKDGNPANNDTNNLWVLCRTCHTRVHLERTHVMKPLMRLYEKMEGSGHAD